MPDPKQPQVPSPREFLKNKRPGRFSDSVVEHIPRLDRSLLEYHLDTLTKRSQEGDFQQFARKLAEREVCPNLLPQTGPTGGGDSKADSETYPVSENLSATWYVGFGDEAARERWAVAISAKKDWRGKVAADIKKLAETGRGYSKAFFISNQFVPDKARAAVEDALRSKFGFDVRILDRTWILDRVFEHHHEELAVEALRMGVELRPRTRKGPGDLKREQRLEVVEKGITEAVAIGRLDLQLVDDCLEAAELSRGLDLPRVEVDGRYERASRFAEKCGTSHQRVRAAYEAAWTAYWWHEDYEALADQYATVETLALDSENVHDLELLSNLRTCLQSAVFFGWLDAGRADVGARTARLSARLDSLAENGDRPSSSLQARALRLLIRLHTGQREEAQALFGEFATVVKSSEGLTGFPLEPLVEILMMLGEAVGDLPGYDELVVTVSDVVARHSSELAAARLLLRRGEQQIAAADFTLAIRTLGRALGKLFKHESRHDLGRALFMCGFAYEQLGLLWAARGTTLAAASLSANEFHTYSRVTPGLLACLRRLKWLELQLGRVPHVLAWHELHGVARVAAREELSEGGEGDEGMDDLMRLDVILGILLLKASPTQLRSAGGVVGPLEALSLDMSATALKFALGYEGEVPLEALEGTAGPLSEEKFFRSWIAQPASSQLPNEPSFYEDGLVRLESTVLGCHIVVEAPHERPAVEVGESVLASLEAFLSVGFLQGVIAREPSLSVRVRLTEVAGEHLTFVVEERSGRPHVEVTCCRFDPHSISLADKETIGGRLVEMVVHLLAHGFLMDDLEATMTQWLRDDKATDRAFGVTSSFGAIGNIFGNGTAYKDRLSSWVDTSARRYEMRRSARWDALPAAEGASSSTDGKAERPKFGTGEPPSELASANVPHTAIEVHSLIREALWRRAGWSGTVFAVAPPRWNVPPVLAFWFEDGQAGAEIFKQWRKELGEADQQERLRIAIVQGIKRAHPLAYRVHVGSNPDVAFGGTKQYAVMVSRLNTMNPSSDANLSGFMAAFARHRAYLLAYATTEGGRPELHQGHQILKHEIVVRQAFEIGRHDPDSVAIQDDDDVIIPSNVRNPPVKDLLDHRRRGGRG